MDKEAVASMERQRRKTIDARKMRWFRKEEEEEKNHEKGDVQGGGLCMKKKNTHLPGQKGCQFSLDVGTDEFLEFGELLYRRRSDQWNLLLVVGQVNETTGERGRENM